MAVTDPDRIDDPVGGGAEDQLLVLEQRLGVAIEHLHPPFAKPEERHHCQERQRDRRERQSPFGGADQAADAFAEVVGEAEEAADDHRSAEEVGEEKPAVLHLEHAGSQVEGAPQADEEPGDKESLDAVPVDEILDRLLALGGEKPRPPGMITEDPGAEKPPHGVHEAVAEHRAEETGREGVIPLQRPRPAGHASGDNWHLLRHREPDPREGQKEHDAEVGTLLEPLDHVQFGWDSRGSARVVQRSVSVPQEGHRGRGTSPPVGNPRGEPPLRARWPPRRGRWTHCTASLTPRAPPPAPPPDPIRRDRDRGSP